MDGRRKALKKTMIKCLSPAANQRLYLDQPKADGIIKCAD